MWSSPPEDRRCTENTRSGEQCKKWSIGDSGKCIQHGDARSRRCTGHITGVAHPDLAGERCRRIARPGQDVCDKHGGSTRHAKLAAARRMLEAELMTLAEAMIGAPVDNPLTELAALAGRARAWMELLQARVEKLLETSESEERDGGGDAKKQGIRYQAGAGEQVRAEIQLYERAMDRLGKFLADYGRLNIDERLSQIEESKAELILKAIDAALAQAGVVGSKAAEAKQVAARHLRAV
jgi:hypothetical protein